MPRRLPEDLSTLEPERLEAERRERDDRLAGLFRRWPGLTAPERAELRRVYDERVRLAKHVGWLRRRGPNRQNASSA
jgi:hypothetical protein